MKALVTGAAGFLGRYLVEQAQAAGMEVRALVRRPAPELAMPSTGGRATSGTMPGVEVVQGDLRDRAAVMAACAGVDLVFHSGAIAGIWGKWKDFYETNVLGTQHVLAGCFEHGVGRLVYTSSPSVTFDGRDQANVDESVPYPTAWLAYYPQTKAMAEQAVLKANECPTARGCLRTCALRPHLIWGPRDTQLIPRLLERARLGRLRQVGAGKNLVDIAYVENVAAAHLQAAARLVEHSPVCGRAYFISQGQPENCWDWINTILARAGQPPIRKQISARAAWAIGGVLETIYSTLGLQGEPPMTRFLAAQLSTDHYYNLARARADFGYAATISTAEGIERMVAAWGKR